jgi:hypothetical protein
MRLKSFFLFPGDLPVCLSPLVSGMGVVMCPVMMRLGEWRGGDGSGTVTGGRGQWGGRRVRQGRRNRLKGRRVRERAQTHLHTHAQVQV